MSNPDLDLIQRSRLQTRETVFLAPSITQIGNRYAALVKKLHENQRLKKSSSNDDEDLLAFVNDVKRSIESYCIEIAKVGVISSGKRWWYHLRRRC